MNAIVLGRGISALIWACGLQELARQHGREVSVRVLEAADCAPCPNHGLSGKRAFI